MAEQFEISGCGPGTAQIIGKAKSLVLERASAAAAASARLQAVDRGHASAEGIHVDNIAVDIDTVNLQLITGETCESIQGTQLRAEEACGELAALRGLTSRGIGDLVEARNNNNNNNNNNQQEQDVREARGELAALRALTFEGLGSHVHASGGRGEVRGQFREKIDSRISSMYPLSPSGGATASSGSSRKDVRTRGDGGGLVEGRGGCEEGGGGGGGGEEEEGGGGGG